MRGDYEELEVVFVYGIFELYKLRELILKSKAEILSNEVILSYNHRFGSVFFNSNITFRSTMIESIEIGTGQTKENRRIVNDTLLFDFATCSQSRISTGFYCKKQ